MHLFLCNRATSYNEGEVTGVQERGGELLGEDTMAQAVLDLINETACTRCLVWSKSDVVIRLVKELAPQQRVGYIIMPDGGQIGGIASLPARSLLRMPDAEVGKQCKFLILAE